MSDTIDVGALVQIAEALKARQALLKAWDEERAAFEMWQAERDAQQQAYANELQALRQHADELQAQLTLLRGELMAAETAGETVEALGYESRVRLLDALTIMPSVMRGQCAVHDQLLSIPLFRRWMLDHASRLDALRRMCCPQEGDYAAD